MGWGSTCTCTCTCSNSCFSGLLIIMLLLFVPLTDGEKEVGTVKHLQENKIYSRGNHKDFTAFLQKQTKKDNPKVQYNF